MKENFSITNETKGKLPSLPFVDIKKKILGDNYELSLVFVGPKKIQNLNKVYRKINKPTDILSFPVSKYSGEIFICPSETRKEAVKFGKTYNDFLSFLFIHGTVHLLGFEHGKKMENLEKKFRIRFGI